MTALPGKKNYSNVYRLIFAWFFLFSVIYMSLIFADAYNPLKSRNLSAELARYRLEKTGKYTKEQIDEYIKIRDLK